MSWLHWLRRACQLGIVLLFCLLPWLSLHQVHVSGSLFALDVFGVPFADPASAAQALVSGGAAGFLPMASFYLGALLTLAISLLLGRVFCGWLCPYGLFAELAAGLRKNNGAKPSQKSLNRAFWLKAAIALAALGMAAALAYPVITLLAMPGQLTLIPWLAYEGIAVGALLAVLILPLGALALDAAAGRRIWCAHVCPQAVFLGAASASLPKKMPGLWINWDARKCACGKASPCREACDLGLNPRRKDGPQRRDCMMCGECVAACRKRGGALEFGAKSGAAPLKLGDL